MPVLKLDDGTGVPFLITTTSSDAQQFSPCAITPHTDPILVTTRPAKPFPTFSTVVLKAINPFTSPSVLHKTPLILRPEFVLVRILHAAKLSSTLPPSQTIPARPPARLLLLHEFVVIISSVEKLLTMDRVLPTFGFPTEQA